PPIYPLSLHDALPIFPWLSVNHTRLLAPRAVPTPVLALDVQRGGIPGHPGAYRRVVIARLLRDSPSLYSTPLSHAASARRSHDEDRKSTRLNSSHVAI